MPIALLMWPYTERSIDRLVVLYEQMDDQGRVWKPPVVDSNAIVAIVNHVISNAEDNLLGTVLGQPIAYERQADFDAPERDAATLRSRWSLLKSQFEEGLPGLSDETLSIEIAHPRRGGVTRFETMLVVARHAAEHLAQAELTRDWYSARSV